MNNAKIRDTGMEEKIINETSTLQKSNRGSIFDYHLMEIKELRKIGLNATAIYKIIKNKMPMKISYNGLLSYIKRNNL